MASVSTGRAGISWSQELGNESLARDGSSHFRRDRTDLVARTTVFVMIIALVLVLSVVMTSIPTRKARTLGPVMPYIVYGYTYDESGDILPSCTLKILDRSTMNSSTTSSDTGGWYQFDLSWLSGGYQTGDQIWLQGNEATAIGLNKTTVTGSGGKWLNLTLSAHTQIRIDSNSDFDSMHGVSSGSGTAIDPYIIENRDISGSGFGYCIYIGNTTDSFILRNCLLHHADGYNSPPWVTRAGAALYNASNGLIWNNTCSNNGEYGIHLNSHSNGNIVSNNSCSDDSYGIFLYSSSSNRILNNTCLNDVSTGINLGFSSNDNLVSNNTCHETAAYGMAIGFSSCGNTIADNICTSNSQLGIFIFASANGNTVIDNTCTSTNNVGLYLESASNNVINGNDCSHSRNGIGLISSSNGNIISNNTCTYDGQSGIFVQSSNGNTLVDNNCSKNVVYGIYVYGSSNLNALSNNNCSFEGGHGICISSSNGNTLSWNTCSFNVGSTFSEDYGVYVQSSSGTILSNNTCSYNRPYGIFLQSSSSNILTDNTCSGNTNAGIVMYPSSGNTVNHNTVTNNLGSGITIGDSGANTLMNNTVSDNSAGISIVSSTGQILRGNAMVNDGISYWTSQGNSGHWNSHDIDTSNTVNGKPVYYYKNTIGGTVPAGAGQVILASCQGMIVENQHLDNVWIGIEVAFSSNISVRNNICSNDRSGSMWIWQSNGNTVSNNSCSNGSIYLLYSSGNNKLENNVISGSATDGINVFYSSNGNTISENTVSHNTGRGIYLYSSSNNRIWNNTFDHNNGAGDTYSPLHIQAYDGGSGNMWNSSGVSFGYGNHWSDWLTPDTVAPWGLVDSPYIIGGGGGGRDYYPLTGYPVIRGGQYTSHAPISIDGNSQFTVANGVVSGSGTVSNPYIIADWDINAGSGNAIYIENTNAYFTVRDCYLHGGTYGSGIQLSSASNGFLYSNDCMYNRFGIRLTSTSSNLVSDNNCSNNNYNGIELYPSSGNTLLNNTCWGNTYHGIIIGDSNGNTLTNNTCGNNQNGIYLVSSTSMTLTMNKMVNDGVLIYTSQGSLAHWNSHNIDSSNTVNSKPLYYYKNAIGGTVTAGAGQVILVSCQNMVVENQFLDRSTVGIALAWSSHNLILNNSCSNNGIYSMGISLYSSSSNTISNNTCSNEGVGIVTSSSSSNTISKNRCLGDTYGMQISSASNSNAVIENLCTNNTQFGLYLYASSSNTLFNNTCSYNTKNGIILTSSSSNTIVNNTCSHNSMFGIYLESSSNGNTLSNNNCSSNSDRGIYLLQSNANTLRDNICGSNTWGGILLVAASSNTVRNNTCNSNGEHGIYLQLYGGPSDSNLIYGNQLHYNLGYGVYIPAGFDNVIWNNTLTGNNGAGNAYNASHLQAYDVCGNSWSSDGYGNFWNDWTRPDANGDGVVDIPYVFGLNQDNYPLTHHPWAYSCTIHLLPGWNLVSIPLVDFTYNASTLGLASGDMVCRWNSLTQTYSDYIVGILPPAFDFEIEPCTGYFILVSAEKNLTLLGDHPDKHSSYSISLDVPVGGGWVDIGWTSFDSSRHASDVASCVSGTNARFMCKWNSTTMQYMSYVVGVSPPTYDFQISAGDAMWMWVDSPGGMLTYSP